MFEGGLDMRGPCERCDKDVNTTTLSWFTEEVICMSCKDVESQIRGKLPEYGREFEGCGFVPLEVCEGFNTP